MMNNIALHLPFSVVYWIILMTVIKYLIMLHIYTYKIKSRFLIFTLFYKVAARNNSVLLIYFFMSKFT